MDNEKTFEWYLSSKKYYQCFRVCHFLGFTKQAYNLLCISIEKLLKTRISLVNGLHESTLRSEYGHNIKVLFSDNKLKSSEYKILHNLCMNLKYNEIRYEFELAITLDHLLDQLDKEIRTLAKDVAVKFNEVFNKNLKEDSWELPPQTWKYQTQFLEKAMKRKQKRLNVDFV